MRDIDYFAGLEQVLSHLKHSGAGWGWQHLLTETQTRLKEARRPTVKFLWEQPRLFTIDGQPLASTSKGLPLAYLVLAGIQHHLDDQLAPATLFTGKNATARGLQALDRAAEHVRPISRPLADCIGRIGVRSGAFTLRDRLPAHIEFGGAFMEQVARLAA
jgi:hypothetical protein